LFSSSNILLWLLQLFQAAGKLEERVGNITSARELYMTSLNLSISAPALVSYAMLETMHPSENSFNYTKVSRLYEEALLLDPRHGPTYNAYGNMELKVGNIEKARQIYQNGVLANCRDVASVFHGLAMLELSLGNIETARLILRKGLKEIRIQDSMMDSSRRKRAIFLVHSLGMLELNCNRAEEAKIIFETGIEQHGNSSQLLLGAALCDTKLGNEEKARRLFEHSVKMDRKHAQAWQSWGVMEMRSGNYKVAKTLFECGIKNDPEHGALWQAYATMESRRGNFEVARA
jgi:tetratricopeptide (TPR) repeat protein